MHCILTLIWKDAPFRGTEHRAWLRRRQLHYPAAGRGAGKLWLRKIVLHSSAGWCKALWPGTEVLV